MQVLFVPLSEPDIELMLPLYNHYVRDTTATLRDVEADAETLRDLFHLDHQRFGGWKIVSDGRPCGLILLLPHRPWATYGPTAEVEVYLDPAWPGKGVGTQALSFIEYRARERKFHTLLAVICAENNASVHLFSKQGFAECARYREVAEKFGRRLDVVCLEKVL